MSVDVTAKPPGDYDDWPTSRFEREIKNIYLKHKRPLAFILGAGASQSSGIPMAGELANQWLKERWETETGQETTFKKWATGRNLGIKGFKREKPEQSYSRIYERAFAHDPEAGYLSLENAMAKGSPSSGYIMLADILSQTTSKVVVTTNFDNLVAEAITISGADQARVIVHNSLAKFIRIPCTRPLVLKIHNDLLFDPQNIGLDKLNDGWSVALSRVFEHYTPVVIGYGGNDGSLMNFLKQAPFRGRLFWCHYGEAEPDNNILDLLRHRNGVLVRTPSFDDLMIRLARILIDDYELTSWEHRLDQIKEKIRNGYQHLISTKEAEAEGGSSAGPGNSTAPNADAKAKQAAETRAMLLKALKDENNWWTWEMRAQAESDFIEKEKIYREAIAKFPNSLQLWTNFGTHVAQQKDRVPEAEQAYRKAIELDPKDALPWNNLGILLKNHTDRYDEAERAYRKAIELDPKDAGPWVSLGNLLQDHTESYDDAEQAYRKAMELDPRDLWAKQNLARLLAAAGNDQEAGELYKSLLGSSDALLTIPRNEFLLQTHLWFGNQAEAAQALAILVEKAKAGNRLAAGTIDTQIKECVAIGRGQALLGVMRGSPEGAFLAPFIETLEKRIASHGK